MDGVGVSVLGGADVDFFYWCDGGGVEEGSDAVDCEDPDCGFAAGAGGGLAEVGGSGWFEFGHGVFCPNARAFTLPLIGEVRKRFLSLFLGGVYVVRKRSVNAQSWSGLMS